MFHELYASGPPWRSSFWTSPLQRWLTKSLALLADHCVTNLANSAQVLLRMTGCPESKFSLLPVFSNVGEKQQHSKLITRKPRMVVFGSTEWRRRAYFDHRVALERACEELELVDVVDIGPPGGAIPKLAVPCVTKGCLTAEEVGKELSDARAGFFTYPVPYLGKSGVFAAYAAHALVSVTYAANVADNKDGLRSGEHFLAMSSTYRFNLDQVENISQKAHEWYRAHSITEHAARYKKLIRRLTLRQQCRKKLRAAHIF